MKKTILTILLCGVMVLGMTGCGKQKNEFDIGNKSDIKISQNDVIMTIKEGTLTNKSATLILTNNSDKNFQYGTPYEIEIKKDGEWHKINVQLDFTLPAFSLKSKETKELEINWKEGYGKLTPGDYRIIKSIEIEKADGTFDTFYLSAKFTIE